MSFDTIPGYVLFCTGLTGILLAGAPIAAALWLHRKKGAAASAFFWGCGLYLVLTLALGQTLSSIAALLPVANALWFAVAYSAVSVAAFNALARMAAFKWIMKDERSLPNAVIFGVGLGWVDALLLLGIDLIFTTAIGLAINRDPAAFAELGNEEMLSSLAAQLSGTAGGPLLASGAERLVGIGMQAALAVPAMVGAGRRRPAYSLGAFALETACLAVLVWLGEVVGSPLLSLAVRLVFTAAAVAFAVFSRGIWGEQDAPTTGASSGNVQTWNKPLARRPLK